MFSNLSCFLVSGRNLPFVLSPPSIILSHLICGCAEEPSATFQRIQQRKELVEFCLVKVFCRSHLFNEREKFFRHCSGPQRKCFTCKVCPKMLNLKSGTAESVKTASFERLLSIRE